jgi:hypothetical protein
MIISIRKLADIQFMSNLLRKVESFILKTKRSNLRYDREQKSPTFGNHADLEVVPQQLRHRAISNQVLPAPSLFHPTPCAKHLNQGPV